jgi:hypothetical protein
MVSRRSKVIQIRGKAYVDGNLVAEGEFTAAIMDRDNSQPKTGREASAQPSPVENNSSLT